MIKGLLIYLVLLCFTISLGLLLYPSEIPINSDSSPKTDDKLIITNVAPLPTGNATLRSSPVAEQVLDITRFSDATKKMPLETVLPKIDDLDQQSDNLISAVKDLELVSAEMRVQEVAYLSQAIHRVQLNDFNVTPSEMLDIEKVYSDGGDMQRNDDYLEDELIPAQVTIGSIPVDTTTPTDVVNYEQMESEMLYKEMIELGQIQPLFEEPQ